MALDAQVRRVESRETVEVRIAPCCLECTVQAAHDVAEVTILVFVPLNNVAHDLNTMCPIERPRAARAHLLSGIAGERAPRIGALATVIDQPKRRHILA